MRQSHRRPPRARRSRPVPPSTLSVSSPTDTERTATGERSSRPWRRPCPRLQAAHPGIPPTPSPRLGAYSHPARRRKQPSRGARFPVEPQRLPVAATSPERVASCILQSSVRKAPRRAASCASADLGTRRPDVFFQLSSDILLTEKSLLKGDATAADSSLLTALGRSDGRGDPLLGETAAYHDRCSSSTRIAQASRNS